MSLALKNFFYIIIVQSGNYIFPIITIPIVARALGPELIGVYGFITAITTYFTLVVTYSFNYTGIRRLSESSGDINMIFNNILYSKVLLFIISVVFYYFIMDSYSFLDNYKLAAWISFLSVFTCVLQNNWIYQFNSDYKLITLFSLISKLLSSVMIILFVRDKGDFVLYISFVQGSMVISSALGFIYSFKRHSVKLLAPKLRQILKFVKNDSLVFFSGVLANMYTTSSIVLLGYFCNAKEVGYYSSSQKVIDLLKNFSVLPLNIIFFPIISKRISQSISAGLDLFSRLLPIFLIVAISSSIALYFLGGFIIKIFFGHDFYESIYLIKILSLGYFSVFFGVILGGQVVLGMNLDKQFVIMQSLVAIFSLIANFVLLPKGGAIATAWVWSISELLMLMFQVIILKYYKVNWFKPCYFLPSSLSNNIKDFIKLR